MPGSYRAIMNAGFKKIKLKLLTFVSNATKVVITNQIRTSLSYPEKPRDRPYDVSAADSLHAKTVLIPANAIVAFGR